jgi:hypothetical protein
MKNLIKKINIKNKLIYIKLRKKIINESYLPL